MKWEFSFLSKSVYVVHLKQLGFSKIFIKSIAEKKGR